jgi:putative DNA primase/helicase
VLSWVIGGWCDYRERCGLDEPAAVLVRTGDYKSESNAIGRFIDDECDVGGAQSAAKTGALYASWQTWATRRMPAAEPDRVRPRTRRERLPGGPEHAR